MSKTFERRMGATKLEVREGKDTITLTGYASTFNESYDMGWYTEDVNDLAFKRTLAALPDVRLLVNHDGLPLARTARTSNPGTLTLDTDSHGLIPQTELSLADPDVQKLAPKMIRGDLDSMSFAFRMFDADGDEWSKDMSRRTLRSLDLNDGDVSVVTFSANPNATAAIRSDGPTVDAITSAIRTLETRGASGDDMAELLDRARAFFRAAPVAAADVAPDGDEACCGCCGTDCCDCVDPECDGTCCPDCPGDPKAAAMPMSMNSAAIAKELRGRQLALIG